MAQNVICPHCHATLRIAHVPSAGKLVKCPKCHEAFRFQPPAEAAKKEEPLTYAPQRQSNAKVWVLTGIAIVVMVGIAAGLVFFALGDRKPADDLANVNTKPAGPGSGTERAKAPSNSTNPNPPKEPETTPNRPSAPNPNGGTDVVAMRPAMKLPATLKANSWVRGLAFAPDGSLLAVATDDGLFLYELSAGQVHRELPLRAPNGVRLLFAPNSLSLAAVTRDKCVVWQMSDGMELASFPLEETYSSAPLAAMAFSPSGNLFAIADKDHGIHVWDLKNGQEVAVMKGHKAQVNAIAFLSDEQNLLSAAFDQTVRHWKIAAPDQHRVLIEGHPFSDLALLPDGKSFVTSAEKIVQWEIGTEGPASVQGQIQEFGGERLKLLPDGKTLAIGGFDQQAVDSFSATLILWDTAKRTAIARREFRGAPTYPVRAVLPALDGQSAAVLAETAQLWDVKSGQMRSAFKPQGTESRAERAALSADGRILAVGFPDGIVNLWPASGGGTATVAHAKATFQHDVPVGRIAFAPDGTSLVAELLPPPFEAKPAAVKQDYDAIAKANKDQLEKLTSASPQLRNKVLSEQHEKLFGILYKKHEPQHHWGDVAVVWDVASGKERNRLREPVWQRTDYGTWGGPNNPVSFSGEGSEFDLGPNQHKVPAVGLSGDRVAWLNRVDGMHVFDVAGNQDKHFQRVAGELQVWQLSPDGRSLFVVQTPPENVRAAGQRAVPTTAVIDLGTRQVHRLLIDLAGSTQEEDVCFAPDGVSLALAVAQADGKVIKIFDVATGREPTPPLNLKAKRPQHLTISADGQLLAFIDAGNRGPELRIVDLITGRERPVSAPTDVAMPTFASDAQAIAVVQKEGEHRIILVVDLRTGQVRTRMSDFTSDHVGKLAFAPDGRTLAVTTGAQINLGSPTLTVRQSATQAQARPRPSELKLFDVGTGKLKSVLGEHANAISDVVFSPDGKTLASSSWDKTVRLWDVQVAAPGPAEFAKNEVAPPPTRGVLVAPATSKPSTRNTPESPSKKPAPRDTLPRETPPTPEKPTEPPVADRPPPDKEQRTEAPAKGARPVETNSIGMKLALLPAGQFDMGSPESDPNAEAAEQPVHVVRISKGFAIGVYEVTIGQFKAFVKATGYETEAEKDGVGGMGYDANAREWGGPQPQFTWKNVGSPQTDNHPVVNVSWNDAKAFCRWLSDKEGKKYRLPTEAEWEYACRAGTKTRFWTGDSVESLQGKENVGDVSLRKKWDAATWVAAWNDGYPFTAPVGSFKPNPWGLYDMHGNAAEWIEDWFSAEYYQGSPATDPKGPPTGEHRVIRGGNWYTEPRTARTAIRYDLGTPSDRNDGWGIRVVREP